MSFGKKDRQIEKPNQTGPSFLDESGFRSDLLRGIEGNNGMDEFSDESLFGEDKIEELMEKKNSFLRGNNMMGADTSFRSKGKNGLRTQEDMM